MSIESPLVEICNDARPASQMTRSEQDLDDEAGHAVDEPDRDGG